MQTFPQSSRHARARTATIGAALVGALLALGLAPGGVVTAGAAPTAGERDPLVTTVDPAERQAALESWTPERMAAAEPTPLLDVPAAAAGGQRPSAQGAGPRAPGQAPSQQTPPSWTGAEWPPAAWPPAGSTARLLDQPPARRVGRLFYRGPDGKPYSCSASVIKSPSGSLLVTAGHCLYHHSGSVSEPSGMVHDVVFVPGYRDRSEPYGAWAAVQLGVPAGWYSGRLAREDFGFVRLDLQGNPADPSGASDRTVQDVVGGFSTTASGTLQQSGLWGLSLGYPSKPTPKYNGERLISCGGGIGLSPAEGAFSLACDMADGSSGGPLLTVFDAATGEGIIFGVIAHGSEQQPGIMFITALGETASALSHVLGDATEHELWVPAGDITGFQSGIQVLNGTSREVDTRVSFLDPSGAEADGQNLGQIGSSSSATVDRQPPGDVLRGARVSTLIPPGASPPDGVGAIVNHILKASAALSTSVAPASGASRVLLPLLMKNHAGFNSFVVVQNADRRKVRFKLTYRTPDGGVHEQPELEMRPGVSVPILQSHAPVPDGPFAGEVNAVGGGKLAVTVFQFSATQLLEYRGFTTDDSGPELVAPILMSNNYQTLTGLQVMNLSPQDAPVKVEYSPNTVTDPDCHFKDDAGNPTDTPHWREKTAKPWAPVTFVQTYSPGAPGDERNDQQFENCTYVGSARITTNFPEARIPGGQPIVAVVNQTGPLGSSAYEAPARHRLVAGAPVHLPIVQANRYAYTGIQVKNVGDQPVKVRLTLRNAAPSNSACPTDPRTYERDFDIGPRASRDIQLPVDPRLALDLVRDCSGEPRFTGSASLEVVPTPATGQGPITAIVNQVMQGTPPRGDGWADKWGDRLSTYVAD